MKVLEIIKEIDKLPNFLYEYCADDGMHMVILGGHSCKKKDHHDNLSICARYLSDMISLYQEEVLTDDDKTNIAKLMKRIMNQCDYRYSGIYSLKEQEEYLRKLDVESLREISDQIEMYKTARKYHAEYIYKK